jgi:Ca2+-transporting ATPase
MGGLIITQGAFLALCSLLAYWFVLVVEKGSVERARTACFIVLACSQLFHSFNCRNMKESIFKVGFLTNNKLVMATLFSFALQMSVIYIPFLQGVFKTVPLGLYDWLLVVVISSFPLWAMEIVKLIRRNMKADDKHHMF